ncbi:MAG TPA: carboxypeptidase regulatory-like domain-containing protein [Terriglobia bacterium]|nr:carboxypeptidase regulatory-like domain-containing protein [Terriglobia bacterium]
MKTKLGVFALVITTFICLASAQLAFGQAATTGNIIGTVTDPTGAAVPGAEVKATNIATGITTTAQTGESGNYSVLRLLPGTYSVTITKNGFQTAVQNNVTVAVGTSTPFNLSLTVGVVTQQVEVTGAPPLVDTTSAEVTTRLSSNMIQSLPISGRNFTAFELLLPGTVRNNFQHPVNENPGNDILVNTNGQEYSANNFMINGMSNNDAVLGISLINPPLDSIQEVKVTTSNYDAEFSQAGGSVIQVQTRSGSNEFHGSAFEYLQNNVFQARDPFTQGLHAPGTPAPDHRGVPELRFNQFGGSIGGPIMKDKLFFFGDAQLSRQNLGGSVLTRVPTAAERNGDLSGLGVRIYDPTTGNASGSGRTLFTNASIPQNRIASQAAALLNFLPLPNVPGATGADPNYFVSGVNNFNTNQFDLRVDHYVNSKLNYFGTFSYAGVTVVSPGAFGLYGGPSISPSGVNMYQGQSNALLLNGTLGINYVFSPTLLGDFRFGANRYRINEFPLDISQNLAEQVGIPGINLATLSGSGGLPNLNINGTGAFIMGYRCNCPLDQKENVFQWVTDWTKMTGNHTVKWGAEIQAAQNLRLPSDNHRAGVYNFNPSVTASAADTSAGSGLASFLLGDPSSFQRFAQVSTNQQDRQKRMFYYVQDTWRATHKLTLSYGVRWDTWFPDTSLHAGQGGRYEISNNLVFIPGIGGNSNSANGQTQWANFSPRFAIAYALRPNTVIRTGFGRSYYQGTFGWTFNNLAADIYPSIVNQQINPASEFFPAQFTNPGAVSATPSIGTAPPLPVFPTIPPTGVIPLPDGIGTPYIPANQKIPYVDSYNFTVEHQLPKDISVEVGYVGNLGRNLNSGWNMNSAIPGPGLLNPRRPYFNLFGITQTIFDKCDCVSSNYNAFQAQVQKRFSKNYSFIANYTWQKALNFGEFGTPTNQYNIGLDYGPATFNRSNVLTIGHSYFLPFGKGQPFASNASGVLSQLISGWEWSGFTTWQAGSPLNATLASNASLNSDMSTRPDQIGDPLAGTPHDRNQWFNPAAFAVPGPFLFGDAGRNAIKGPNWFTFDMSLSKSFNVTERVKAKFRWDAFNAFNNTNLANPSNTNIDTPTAGLITDVQAPMRNMQFGLHITW